MTALKVKAESLFVLRAPTVPRVTGREAMRQLVRWSEAKAGSRSALITALGRLAPGARGLAAGPSQVSRWKAGTAYDADILIAMVSYLTDRSVDDLMNQVHDNSRLTFDQRLRVVEARTGELEPRRTFDQSSEQ